MFLSPFSIRMALAMVFEGARGDTATQIDRAVCLQTTSDTVAQSFANAHAHLDGPTDDRAELAVANSLWGQHSSAISPDYGDVIARAYGGEMHLVDFALAEEALGATNSWVSDRTRGRIQDMLSRTDVNATTRLVLVNAILAGRDKFNSLHEPAAVFRADHPFLFAVRDRRDGTILFLGRVTNPTA